MTKKILSREEILNAQDLKRELVDVPEWGGAVYVRTMTGRERDAFEASLVAQRGRSRQLNLNNFRAKLLAMTIVDENGKQLFSEADIGKLGDKSAAALDRVFAVASRLSALTEADIEELTREFEENPFESSSSN